MFKVKAKASSNYQMTIGNNIYIFKNSINIKNTGIEFTLSNFFEELFKTFLHLEIKNKIKIFKEKFGNAIVNGNVIIKVEPGKITYIMELAKTNKLDEFIGSLSISLEPKFNLDNVSEKIANKLKIGANSILIFIGQILENLKDFILNLIPILIVVFINLGCKYLFKSLGKHP